ncbi:MAG: serine--tRNA ligase [Patescibacteria group bacterium]
MLDIKFIKDNLENVKQNCLKRNVKIDWDKFLQLDKNRLDNLTKLEAVRNERNQKSKSKPSPEEIEKMKKLGEEEKILDQRQKNIDEEFKQILTAIPNMTHPETPIGGESDYKVLGVYGKKPNFSFETKDHVEILEKLDLIDFERGAKTSGAKFYFAKNDLVLLNQAIINYGIELATKAGFTLIETPDLAKRDILEGIGFNPRGEETQVYNIENSDLSLIGSAEITIGGFHSDEILDFSDGPKKYVAISHCFRTEAGSYGKTSKGLYRVHQFTKLELFVFCKPEDSEKYHEEILNLEKEIVDGLDVNYRVIDIPSGDLGGPAYRKYDIEAFMTMHNDFGEITSCSNCTDYQARRLNIKYKDESGKNKFVHTLNGTAVNTSRWPLFIVENYQQADGSIKIPKVLQKWMGKKVIKK